MTDRKSLTMARLATFKISDTHRENHRPLIWLAQSSRENGWLWLEWQHFFLEGIYNQATGNDSAGEKDIIDLMVTADGATWIQDNCLNPFWFWSVIHFACQYAEMLPLTEQNLEDGAKVCLDEARDYMTTTQTSGWPDRYSGPEVPWHVWDLFNRGQIWNNRGCLETGLSLGLLMMQRVDGVVQVIYNPMLAKLSMEPPAITNSGE